MNVTNPRVLGLDMSVEQVSQAVLRLCHFAPAGSGTFARDLMDFLVESALATQQEGLYSVSEIRSSVQDMLPLQFEYEEILESLKRLIQRDVIHCQSALTASLGDRFGLKPSRRVELDNEIRHVKAVHGQRIQEWLNHLNEKYPFLTSADLDCLHQDLVAFLVNLISFHGAESIALIYEDDVKVAELLQESRGQLSEILLPRAEHVDRIRSVELPAFFYEASAERKDYIGSLLNSAFVLHMLHLDPQCSAIVKSQLQGGILYLDTNVVYRLLGLQGPELFLATKRLVEISRELNYQLVVSPLTVDEFKESLRHNAYRLPHVPMLPPELLEIAINASTEEDFVKAFLRRKRSAWVSPEVFVEYYEQVGELLLNEYEIPVAIEEFRQVDVDEQELAAEISKLSMSIEDFKRYRYGDDIDLRLPHDEVIKHDAYHRLLIRALRGKEPERFSETPYWFLTCDSKLPRYDRFARKGPKGIPFCALSGQWLQVLRPFLPRHEDFEEALASCVISPFLSAFRPLSGDVVHDILGRMAMIKPTLPGVAAKIVANRQFIEQFAGVDSEEIRQELVENEIARIAEEYERDKEALSTKLNEMQADNADLIERTENLQGEIETQREESAKEVESLQTQLAQSYRELRSLREEGRAERSEWRQERDRLATRLKQLEEQTAAMAGKNEELQRIRKQRDTMAAALKWSVPVIATLAAGVTLWFGQPWIRLGPPWNLVSTILVVVFWITSFAVPLGTNPVFAIIGFFAAMGEILNTAVSLLSKGS